VDDSQARRTDRARRQQIIRRRRLAAVGVLVAIILLIVIVVMVACGSNSSGTTGAAAGGKGGGKQSGSPKPSPSPSSTALRKVTAAAPLRLAAYGESVGNCTIFGLGLELQGNKKVKYHVYTKPATGLARPDFFSWPNYVNKDFVKNHYDAVLFIVGGNDAQDLWMPNGDMRWGSKGWEKEYGRRVGKMMDFFLSRGAQRVYWAGMPRMGIPSFNERIPTLNKVYQAEAAKRAPFVVYIDAWTLLDAPTGTFTPSLRQADGVHLNDAGDIKSGKYTYKIIMGDWKIK
jgi:uncharacterized protein